MKHERLEQSVTVFIDRIDSAHNKKVYVAYKEALESQAIDFIGFDDKHFSPSINFVDSEFTIGVQIADIIAGALWRGVEKKQKTYSQLLLSRFPRDSNDKYIGYSYQVCEKWK